MAYLSPAAEARFEQEIQKSRFIGIVHPARSPEEVDSLLAGVREEFEDATHHCWAYLLGDPERAPRMRFEDAGEPAGTAGKPILNVLRNRGIGDALVVVVRYFGGIKLGAGGLARAYSSTASRVLDAAELLTAVPRVEMRIRLDYADEAAARHLLDRRGIEILAVSYGDGVLVTAKIAESETAALSHELSERTSGRARVEARRDGV